MRTIPQERGTAARLCPSITIIPYSRKYVKPKSAKTCTKTYSCKYVNPPNCTKGAFCAVAAACGRICNQSVNDLYI